MARYARHTATPLPLLTGGDLSLAEYRAAEHASLEWTFTEQLMVVTAERTDMIRHGLQSIFSEKGQRITDPLQIPRPGEEPQKPVTVTGAELAQMLRQGGGIGG